MNNLHAMVCKMCGAPLDTNLVCPCCGVAHKLDNNNHLITVEHFNSQIVYLNGSFRTPAYLVDVNAEAAMKYTLDEITKELAHRLLPLIEFRNSYEPREMCYRTDCRLGVVDPFTYSRRVEPFKPENFKFMR